MDRGVIADQRPPERQGLLEGMQRLGTAGPPTVERRRGPDRRRRDRIATGATTGRPLDLAVRLRCDWRVAGIVTDQGLENRHGLPERPERRGRLADPFLFVTIGSQRQRPIDAEYGRQPDWREPAAPGSRGPARRR